MICGFLLDEQFVDWWVWSGGLFFVCDGGVGFLGVGGLMGICIVGRVGIVWRDWMSLWRVLSVEVIWWVRGGRIWGCVFIVGIVLCGV